MKLSEYINALGLEDYIQSALRYVDCTIPRSRVALTYTNGRDKVRNYAKLLSTVLEIRATELFGLNSYYEITRYNSSSCAMDSRTYANTDVLFYACTSHTVYNDACNHVTTYGRLLDYSLVTAPFEIPGWNVFYGVHDGSNNSTVVVLADKDSIIQEALNLVPNIVASMLYNRVEAALRDKYPDNYADFKPEVLWDTYTVDGDIFSDAEFDVPEFLTQNLEQILAQRQTEEEARRLREEEERQRALAEAKAKLAEKTVEFLSKVNVTSTAELEQRRIKSDIEDMNSYIRDYSNKIAEYQVKIEAKQREYTSYCFQAENEVTPASQLAALIGPDKCMRAVINGTDKSITIACVSPILYWEQDEVDQWKRARNGKVWDAVRVVTSGRFQLMTGAKVTVQFAPARVEGTTLDKETIALICGAPRLARHPHVARYSCFGNNEYTIRDALTSRQYDIAATYINSCMMQLNLTDGCVVQSMAEFIYSNVNEPYFFDTVEKKYVSFVDAQDILNQEDAQ